MPGFRYPAYIRLTRSAFYTTGVKRNSPKSALALPGTSPYGIGRALGRRQKAEGGKRQELSCRLLLSAFCLLLSAFYYSRSRNRKYEEVQRWVGMEPAAADVKMILNEPVSPIAARKSCWDGRACTVAR